MYYVYIIKSDAEDWQYVGYYIRPLRARLKDHNNGKVASTRNHRRPYTIESYIAVQEKTTALELEKYFKTGMNSGQNCPFMHL
ncbi:GIY-YIG nuclease family protein [Rhodohalobacter sp.]|uniref:GIY-YIG nuclease family protein n=1 Tax=Rhodohalobacter sp. TaxID=1974210 RepID=UPI002ACD7556|nr:GIY-YIG nuclease family protein [Rhodohalobacter sp.]MDZ7758107.1 GIY-YIG nuclease family protein [Rhodohalobacter sp.]